MAAISDIGFRSWFSWRKKGVRQAKDAHIIADRAYRVTNGPTEELKNVYRAYLENKARSAKNKSK